MEKNCDKKCSNPNITNFELFRKWQVELFQTQVRPPKPNLEPFRTPPKSPNLEPVQSEMGRTLALNLEKPNFEPPNPAVRCLKIPLFQEF